MLLHSKTSSSVECVEWFHPLQTELEAAAANQQSFFSLLVAPFVAALEFFMNLVNWKLRYVNWVEASKYLGELWGRAAHCVDSTRLDSHLTLPARWILYTLSNGTLGIRLTNYFPEFLLRANDYSLTRSSAEWAWEKLEKVNIRRWWTSRGLSSYSFAGVLVETHT